MKSRIFVDFSSPEAANKNWEQLVRVLFDKPLYKKPAIGRPPAYLTATSKTASPANGKLESLKSAISSGSKQLKLYRADFLSTCLSEADSLRIRKDPQLDQNALAQKVLEDCGSLKDMRNRIVDWILYESSTGQSDDFREALLQLLEKLLELKGRPEELNPWNLRWMEAQSVFVYEAFLYIVAALLKTGSFSTLHEVFASHYLIPAWQQNGNEKFVDFSAFWGYSDLLQILAPEGKRLHCPAAELISRQADRSDLRFQEVMEAELVVLLSVLIRPGLYWYPQTLVYQSRGDFPFFIRATQHRHFQKIAEITGISDAEVIREKAKKGFDYLRLDSRILFALHSTSLWGTMNFDKLDSL